ncbi:MAG: hypothetical protein H7X71_07755 [Chitinophagales bacterium]|nr:hypothetical protein [Chitinophagales bacterium]
MQNTFFTLIVFSTISFSASAQYLEMGIFGGGAVYNGDLSHHAIELSEVHPAFGIKAATPLNAYFALSLNARYTTLTGTDDNSQKPAFAARNLDFRTTFIEAGLTFECFLFGYDPLHQKIFSPFIYTGVNWFHFNPTTEYNGVTYELQPLGTEGQGTSAFPDRTPYALSQVSIPMGAGLKYAVSRTFNIALSFTANKTFTDYIDDVSTTYVDETTLTAENGALSFELSNRTDEYLNSEPLPYDEFHPRGNPAYKDWYGYGGITLSYNLIFEKTRGSYKNAHLECPQF